MERIDKVVRCLGPMGCVSMGFDTDGKIVGGFVAHPRSVAAWLRGNVTPAERRKVLAAFPAKRD